MRWSALVMVMVSFGVAIGQEKEPPPPPPPRKMDKEKLDERVVERVERWLKRWAPWLLEELEKAVRRSDGRLLKRLHRLTEEMDELRESDPDEFKERLMRMKKKFGRRDEGDKRPAPPMREEVERLLHSDRFAVLRESAPWLIEQALKTEPNRLRDILSDLERMNDELAHLRETAPERYKLRIRVLHLRHKADELAEAYHRTDSEEEREELRRRLKETLTQLFKMRMREMEQEIESLAKELDHLKRLHEKYKINAEKIIKRKLEEMLEDDERFEW